jgi:hypothetical protein
MDAEEEEEEKGGAREAAGSLTGKLGMLGMLGRFRGAKERGHDRPCFFLFLSTTHAE